MKGILWILAFSSSISSGRRWTLRLVDVDVTSVIAFNVTIFLTFVANWKFDGLSVLPVAISSYWVIDVELSLDGSFSDSPGTC